MAVEPQRCNGENRHDLKSLRRYQPDQVQGVGGPPLSPDLNGRAPP